MAGGGKSKVEGQEARPDGTVRWSKSMREALAQFNDRPCLER